MNSLVEFWSGLPCDAKWHPADYDVLHRTNHGFQLDCLPGPFKGRLLTAPVVLLALSPGFQPLDLEHAQSPTGQNYYARSRKGDCDLPSFDEHEGSQGWSARIIKQFGVDYDAARPTIAFLNMGAYKSKSFTDWHMLSALPSSRAAIDWAQSELFPSAIAGKRIVVCLRSAKYWGLEQGVFGESLFVPEFTRGGIMCHGALRDQIVSEVREAVLSA